MYTLASHLVERLEEVRERTTESNHLPRRTLESLYTLVRYGADTKRIRMFLINEREAKPENRCAKHC